MIDLIPWILLTALSLIAALHLLWATGSTWPLDDPAQFARTFVGIESDRATPGAAITTAVALLIFAAGVLPVWVAGHISLPLPSWCGPVSMWVLVAVFGLRGLSTYALPNLPRAEPFKSLDRRYFAPLCLLLGAGFLSLALSL